MDKIKIDKKDHKILYQLDLNSRQPDAEIGRKVGLSREVVKYRIKNLIKNGIIERFYTIIDTAKLGLTFYKLYFQFQNLNKNKEEEMIKFFQSLPNYGWLGITSGKWDMIVGLWCRNIHEFNEIFMKFSDKYSQYVMSKSFTTTINARHYRKEYLIGKRIATEPKVTIGEQTKKVSLDNTDVEILKILANNARMPLIEIAKKVKTSQRIASYRIKELQKKKVIKAFRLALNLPKLNLLFFKAFLYLQNLNEETLKKLTAYCGSLPNLGWIILCVGSWEMEIEFEIESLEKFEEAMKNIRENFGNIIKGTETLLISREFGGSQYFPGCYGKIDKIYKE